MSYYVRGFFADWLYWSFKTAVHNLAVKIACAISEETADIFAAHCECGEDHDTYVCD